MAETTGHPPNWYPDPWGRHEHRYFDGQNWTEHVASHGRQSVDPPGGSGRVPTVSRATQKVQRDVERAGVQAGAAQGGGTLFTEPVLVVNQKAKLIEITNEYASSTSTATRSARSARSARARRRRCCAFVANVDQFITHKLEIVDAYGQVAARAHPARQVHQVAGHRRSGDGQELGQIVQQNVIGKIRFGLESDGQQIGTINGENWRAWNFNIEDHTGTEVARITKTWEGLAKTMFTPPTTTSCRSTSHSRSRCTASSSPRRSADRHRPQAGRPRTQRRRSLRLTRQLGQARGIGLAWSTTRDVTARVRQT